MLNAQQVADVQAVQIMEYRLIPLPPNLNEQATPERRALIGTVEQEINELCRDAWFVQAWGAGFVALARVTGVRQIAVDVSRVVLPVQPKIGRA